MQVNITARHGQLSSGTREKIKSKVEKLAKFYDRVTEINVTADLKKEDAPKVEVRVSAELTHDLVASDAKSNILSSIESIVQKLEQQLKRHKEKLQDHRGTGRRTEVEVDDETEVDMKD